MAMLMTRPLTIAISLLVLRTAAQPTCRKQRQPGLHSRELGPACPGSKTNSPQSARKSRPERHEPAARGGLSFGLIHPRPSAFTGVRVFVFAQATDGGERW